MTIAIGSKRLIHVFAETCTQSDITDYTVTMTLICTHLGGSSGFLGVSDILLTAVGDSPSPTPLPLRPTPIYHVHAGRSLAGAAQKSVPFGRTLISWSGPKRIANKVLVSAMELSDQGQIGISMDDLFRSAQLTYSDAHKIQLIYNYVSTDSEIITWAWRCSRKKISGTDAIFGGSGGPSYADITDVHAPDEQKAKDDVTAILARAIGQLVLEVTTDDTLDQQYGGWIELSVCRGDHFAKLQYAVKIWYLNKSKDAYSPGPLIFSFYRNYELIVAKFSFEVSGNQKSRELFEIGDVFGRGVLPDRPGPNVEFNPMSIFHVAIDAESNQVNTFMTAGDNLGYHVSIDRDFNIDLRIEPRFWQILTGRDALPGMWLVE